MTKKILVIDDEPDILTTIARRLIANQYQVMTAASGEEGLALARKDPPDLVLLDYIMPDMSGDEVLQIFQKDAALRSVPVVMFTVDIKQMKTQAYRKFGATSCLIKPFKPSELLNKIRELLGESA